MIKVLLVDDSAIFLSSIKLVLNNIPKLRVVGSCSDGIHVLPFVANNPVDVILMDYYMPKLNGVEATKMIKSAYPDIKVIGFSNVNEKGLVEDFLVNGASGFLSKFDANTHTLETTILNALNKE